MDDEAKALRRGEVAAASSREKERADEVIYQNIHANGGRRGAVGVVSSSCGDGA